jgi:hypothetical protein
MPNLSTQGTRGGTTNGLKTFKVRIEFDNPHTFYAIEAWMKADNIIKAGELVMTYFGALGIDAENVVKLVEMDER